MKSAAFLIGLPWIAISALAQTAPSKPSADPVVLTIGEEKITRDQFELLVATLPEQQRTGLLQSPERKRKLAEQYAEMEALAEDARAKRLDEMPLVKTRLSMQEDQVLATAAYSALGEATPDEAAIKNYYSAHYV